MITLHRTATAAPGHFAQALAFAREAATMIHARTGVEVVVALPVGGNPSSIGWTLRFDSLAHYDATMQRLHADATYGELLARNAAHFNAGSVYDELWRAA